MKFEKPFLKTAASVAVLCVLAAGCGGDNNKAETAPEAESAAGAPAPASSSAEREVAPAPSVAKAAAPAREELLSAATTALAGLEGDAVRGKRVFVKCMACHSLVEGQTMTGPSLHGVIGANAGHAQSFPRYSKAMAGSGVVWTEEALFAYLANPAAFVPGNGMLFPGLPDAQDRADVIAYLKSASQ